MIRLGIADTLIEIIPFGEKQSATGPTTCPGASVTSHSRDDLLSRGKSSLAHAHYCHLITTNLSEFL